MTDDRDLVTEVVEALAAAERVPAENLPYTLHDYLDPDVLAALSADDGATWEFTFEVETHEVTVTSDGSLFVDGVLWETDALARGVPE